MKKILMISGFVVLMLFLVACAKQGGESAFAGQASNVVRGCSCKEVITLLEGEKYTTADGTTLILSSVENKLIQLKVDNILSSKLGSGQTQSFAGAKSVNVLNIVSQTYEGGIHQTTLCWN